MAMVGMNSCRMPRTPLSASGAVAREELIWLKELGRDVAFADARFRPLAAAGRISIDYLETVPAVPVPAQGTVRRVPG
jgi:hypothetical protein